MWGSRLRPHVALVAGPPAHVPPRCIGNLSSRVSRVKILLLCGNGEFGFPKVSQARFAAIVSWARWAVIVSGPDRVELVLVVHALANLSDFFQWRLARWAAQERSFVKLEFDAFGSRHGVNST